MVAAVARYGISRPSTTIECSLTEDCSGGTSVGRDSACCAPAGRPLDTRISRAANIATLAGMAPRTFPARWADLPRLEDSPTRVAALRGPRVGGSTIPYEEALAVDCTRCGVVSDGGELCINARTRGTPLRNGWLAGILLEPVVEE